MTNVNPLTTVSLMLTLAGLLGTFFNIQLSQWLRDLMALHRKAELNAGDGSQAERRVATECRVELAKLVNWPTTLISVSIVIMVTAALVNGVWMAQSAVNDPMYPHIVWAMMIFLAYFVILSGLLLGRGTSLTIAIHALLEAKPGATRG